MTVANPAENGAPVENGAPAENGALIQNGTPVDVGLAAAPCNLDSVPGLLEEISSLGSALSGDDGQARLKLLANARSLVTALETPRETMIKHCWAQVSWTNLRASRHIL